MVHELTIEQRRRMPGYVLDYIDTLERKLADRDRALAERELQNSNVWLRSGLMLPDEPLPPDAEVRFDMGTTDENHVDAFRRAHYIDVRHDSRDPGLLTINGARRLLITPWASNHFYVSVAPR